MLQSTLVILTDVSFLIRLCTMAPGIQSVSAPDPTPLPQRKATAQNDASNDQYGRYYPADPATLNLESNFGPMDPASIGYLQPTSADTPLEIMRERFERDGYLHVLPFLLSTHNPR